MLDERHKRGLIAPAELLDQQEVIGRCPNLCQLSAIVCILAESHINFPTDVRDDARQGFDILQGGAEVHHAGA